MSVGFSIGFSIVALIFGLAALALGVWSIIEVMSFRRSTHNIQYVPLDNQSPEQMAKDEKAFEEAMAKANQEFMQPPMQNEVI